MSGKIALPSTPKLEDQTLFEADGPKPTVTRKIVKGAVLGAAAWFVASSALGSGPFREYTGFAPWGWDERPHSHQHDHPLDCSVWDEFDFDAPLQFGQGRHGLTHPGPRPPTPPDMPAPPAPPHAPHTPGGPRPPTPPAPPHPPHAPDAPPPPRRGPPIHEALVFNISTSAPEIRLAAIGILGHGLVRVEPAAEGVEDVQVEVRGAHGRVCALKEDDEIVGVGLVGYMHGRGPRGRGKGWWWRRGEKSRKRRHDHHQSSEGEDQEDEFEVPNEDTHPPPPDGEFPPPPGVPGPLPPPPPPGRKIPPPPPGVPGPPPPPHWHPHHIHAPIIITLRVPTSSLPALKTRLPFFTHDIAANSSASFAGLDLATRDASIGLGSVVVREGGNITVHSSNAPIRGDIQVQDGYAVIETRNAVIDVTLGFNGSSAGAELKSSNAPIIASLDIRDSGRFAVSALTSNAHLALNVTAQPEGALLFLDARTSNAPASVQLHPNFEGTFELTSSVVSPGVVVVEDKEGRKVTFERDGGKVVGSVWYEKSVKQGGNVVVSTSNAPNTLLL